MKKHSLKADIRSLVGRKVKNLRSSGNIPAAVYGKKVKSISVTVSSDAFAKVYAAAGETGLVELAVGSDVRPVLIHNVQRNPLNDTVIHVEFFQVDLKEKVKTRVPVEFTGESPVVSQKQGVLLTLLDEVEVEALPTDLPEKITLDISSLNEIDKELKVGDLPVPSGVVILTEPTVGVVKVGSLVTKEAQAEAQAAEQAAAAAAATAETAEGAEEKKEADGEKKEEAAPAPEGSAQKPKEEKTG